LHLNISIEYFINSIAPTVAGDKSHPSLRKGFCMQARNQSEKFWQTPVLCVVTRKKSFLCSRK